MIINVTPQQAWSGEADCRQCSLRSSALFAGLRESDFEQIHRPIQQEALSAGAALYSTGERGEHLFTVRSGLVKLIQYLPDGARRIVRLVRPADILGMEALLGQPYLHEAVAMQPTEVCRLPVAVVEHLSRDNPELHRELLNRWQQALQGADAWITELSTGSARQRVARLLLRLQAVGADPSAPGSNPGSNPESLLIGREDMGAMLGITTETASRTVAEFKRQGVLRESRPHHCRIDVERLQAIAET